MVLPQDHAQEGELVDKKGNHFDLMVIGDNIQQDKNNSTIDLRMKITGDGGIIYDEVTVKWFDMNFPE